MSAELQQHFSDYIKAEDLFTSDEKLLVACSGGIDSMVLCHLLLQLDYPFEIAHVNYGLRGEASNEDEKFVRRFGQQYFLPVHVHRVSPSSNKNIQEWARDIRYDFFNRLVSELEFDKILTAHHFDDQIETSLLNFTRGSGVAGLRGMKPKREKLVRPLLFARRNAIESYAKAKNIRWREDASNTKLVYRRNKIRHEIAPLLYSIRGTDKGMESTLQHLRELDGWMQDHFTSRLATFREINGHYKIPLNDFGEHHRTFELFQLLRPFRFNREQVDDLFHAQTNGAQITSHSHIAVKDRGFILIKPLMNPSFLTMMIYDNHFPITLQLGNASLRADLKTDTTIDINQHIAQFDKDNLDFPLIVRPWKKGDRFKPFGMYGKSKKVSDLFTHLKLSAFDKAESMILTDAKGKILWVVGWRRSEMAPVTEKTKQVIQITHTFTTPASI